jgi:hypothetical protein
MSVCNERAVAEGEEELPSTRLKAWGFSGMIFEVSVWEDRFDITKVSEMSNPIGSDRKFKDKWRTYRTFLFFSGRRENRNWVLMIIIECV